MGAPRGRGAGGPNSASRGTDPDLAQLLKAKNLTDAEVGEVRERTKWAWVELNYRPHAYEARRSAIRLRPSAVPTTGVSILNGQHDGQHETSPSAREAAMTAQLLLLDCPHGSRAATTPQAAYSAEVPSGSTMPQDRSDTLLLQRVKLTAWRSATCGAEPRDRVTAAGVRGEKRHSLQETTRTVCGVRTPRQMRSHASKRPNGLPRRSRCQPARS